MNRRFLGRTSPFTIWTTAVVGVLVAAIVIVTVIVDRGARPSTTLPAAAVASDVITDDGGIVLSEGATQLALYSDPMCSWCALFEKAYTPLILADEEFGLTFHPVSILDRASAGTEFSTRASASIYAVAVANADAVQQYIVDLFDAQPEHGASMTDDELIALAAGAGATITANDIAAFTDHVTAATQHAPRNKEGRVSTPAVTVGGEYATLTGDPGVDLAGFRR